LSLQIDPVREHELQQEDQACHKKRWRIIKMVMFLRRPGGQSQFSTHLGSEADAVRDSRWIQTWVLGQPDPDKGREVFSSLSVEAQSRPDMRRLQTWILAHPHARGYFSSGCPLRGQFRDYRVPTPCRRQIETPTDACVARNRHPYTDRLRWHVK